MKHFLFITLIFIGQHVWSQDIHFTNFQLAPMSLNPALAGSFQGTIRASGIFRDQNSGGYNTLAGGLEYNIPFAFRKQDWITIGIEYLQDKEKVVDGINVNTLNQTNLTLAYHYALDKKYRNVLTAAIQYKVMSAKFNKNGLKTGSSLSDIGESPTLNRIQILTDESRGNSMNDYVAGITWQSKIGKQNSFGAGFSLAHVVRVEKSVTAGASNPKNPFSKVGRDVLPNRYTFFANGEFFINKIMSIQPVIYYQSQSPFSELIIQSFYGLVFDPVKNIKINPGLGYRVGDAVEFLFTMDFGKFKVGAAFDLTSSAYSSSEGQQNALEFGLSYTTTIITKPKVKPVIFCPRL